MSEHEQDAEDPRDVADVREAATGEEQDPYEARSLPTQTDPTDDDPASYVGR